MVATMSAIARVAERAADAIEQATFLDRLSDLGQRLTALLPPGRTKDLLSGTPIGHPAHPALVALPLGALSIAGLLDAVGAEAASSRRLKLLGLCAAVPAAAAGLSDWNDTQGPERRVGTTHALSNLSAIGMFAASCVVERPAARATLSLTGLGILGFGGWLGGHLAFALGVGVDTTAFQKPPTTWTDACALDQLEDGVPIAVTVEDAQVMIVRQGTSLHAIWNRCTHRGGPLHEGVLVDGCIECPWHQSRFDITDGSVARGPATRPQGVFEVRQVAGRVEVRREETRTMRLNPTR